MKKSSITVLSILFMVLTACRLPEGYIPDEQVIYLKQKLEYGPIRYEPMLAQPYTWNASPVIDPANPVFLRYNDLSPLLRASFEDDVRTYQEIASNVAWALALTNIQAAFDYYNKYDFSAPPARPLTIGAKKTDFQNATGYHYPPVSGAQIIDFGAGDYKIELPDGNIYYAKPDGSYFETDSRKKELYAVFPSADQYRVLKDDVKYTKFPDGFQLVTPVGEVEAHLDPVPQLRYVPPGENYYYTFFTSQEVPLEGFDFKALTFVSIAVIKNNGFRVNFYPDQDSIQIIEGEDSIQIYKNYSKVKWRYDWDANKPVDIVSIYGPNGQVMTGFDKPVTYSTITPNYPEKYLQKKVGPFNFLYTEKDRAELTKFNTVKLNKVHSFALEKTGLKCAPGRSVILPPDLESYRRLHCGERPETLNWYPSGFQGGDLIIMWPPSVPRYNHSNGETYFWDTEIYDILLHEFVHLLVDESTGLFGMVPVWLNEGLAVSVESDWSPEAKTYWETTFEGSVFLNRLLPWDDITVRPTSYYPVGDARVHYAQSYKMVSMLVERYGRDRTADYIRSFKFRGSPEEWDSMETIRHKLASDYKDNFKDAYGVGWEENLQMFTTNLAVRKGLFSFLKKDG